MNHNQPNLNEAQLEALLKITSQRLGTTPEQLKQAAQSGNLDRMLGQNEGAALQKVLKDPEAAKKLLSSPQAQKLFQMLQKERK